MVQFADALQVGLQLSVVAQLLPDQGNLSGGKADLLGAAARVTDGQNPDPVPLPAGADGIAGGMPDGAMQQRAAEDLGGGGESGGEFGAGFIDRLLASFITMKHTNLRLSSLFLKDVTLYFIHNTETGRSRTGAGTILSITAKRRPRKMGEALTTELRLAWARSVKLRIRNASRPRVSPSKSIACGFATETS